VWHQLWLIDAVAFIVWIQNRMGWQYWRVKLLKPVFFSSQSRISVAQLGDIDRRRPSSVPPTNIHRTGSISASAVQWRSQTVG